jgi:hypothetical protein
MLERRGTILTQRSSAAAQLWANGGNVWSGCYASAGVVVSRVVQVREEQYQRQLSTQ